LHAFIATADGVHPSCRDNVTISGWY